MKYLLFLLLFVSFNTFSQKVDIILVGVSHNYSTYPKQDFSGIYTKIRKFKPSAFFGEFLSKEDEKLVMDYWCKKDNNKRLQLLKHNRDIPQKSLPQTIDSLKKLIQAKPTDFRLKTDLAHAYYLDQDVANGHYQFWQVFHYLNQTPNIELENYVNKVLSPQLDTTGRSMRRLKTSEYADIAFPLMQEMGMKELWPMDSQEYDLNWVASWAAFDAKFEEFRKDTSATFQHELKTKLSKINKGFARYDSVGKSSSQVTEWLNTPEAAIIAASGDFYLPEMYGMKNFPEEEMQSKINWWMRRNQTMCENVVNRARAAGLQKIVVLAGASHRKYMQDIFKTMPNVNVRNINEVQ